MRAKRCARTGRPARAVPVLLLGVALLLLGAGPPEVTDRAAAAAVPLPGPPGEGAGGPAVGRSWPVGAAGGRPRVVRGWEPPATPYGPGHRGVDLAAAAGAPVRAVAPGRVSFAGRVAGRPVVSVELAGTGEPPLRTTYGPVRATVTRGEAVTAGDVLGVLEPAAPTPHCTASCLHWGLLRADAYLDPLSLLPPWLLRRGPSRLLPVAGVPEPRARAGGRVSPGRPAEPS